MCTAAVMRITKYLNRTGEDTGIYDPAADTVPTMLRDAAKRCVAKSDINDIPEPVLRFVYGVYLNAGDQQSAKMVIDRYVAAAPTVEGKAQRLSDVIRTMLRAGPVFGGLPYTSDLTLARHYLTRLDSTPPSKARLDAHYDLEGYYSSRNRPAEAIAVWLNDMRILAGLPAQEREPQYTLRALSLLMLSLQNERSGGVPARRMVDSAIAVLSDLPEIPLASMITSALEQAVYGQPAPPLQADFVLGEGSGPPFPTPGVVTYLWWTDNRADISALRRIKQILGDSVNFVAVAPLRGHWQKRIALDPKSEVDSIRRYYLDELKFPGQVVVSKTEFHQIPDGRYLPGPSVNEQRYGNFLMRLSIIDKDGKRQPSVALPWSKSFEQQLLAELRAVLKRPPEMWWF